MEKNIEIGQRFGKLTVVSFAEKKAYRNYWNCKCNCGNMKAVREDHLINNKIISCGCYRQNKPASNLLNLVGKRFGKLTVLSFAYIQNSYSYWNCKCDCGNTFIACGKLLTRGTTKSCGCLKHNAYWKQKDLTGCIFGQLKVIKIQEKKKGQLYWLCQCTCGKEKIIRANSLLQGNTKSCGCTSVHNFDTFSLAKEFNRSPSSVLKAKHKFFGNDINQLTEEQKNIIKNYFISTESYLNSDCSKLAQEYKRHVSTIIEAKHKLFGKNISVLSDKQKKQLTEYFSVTENSGASFAEKEVVTYIKSIYKEEIVENDRSIIAPKELDIYIPEKSFAVEFDGLYWHSEAQGKGSTYHLTKTKMCMSKGIRLLHIYENEWRDKQDICKSMIASALGVYERKEYARKCEVREIKDRKTVIDFFDQNHIQGAVHKFSLCLGLYKDDELLQAVVFGNQHFGRNGDIELYRMVTLKNTQVLGGFSKLMQHCPYDTVVSYVALRMFDAKGYLAGNWKIEHTAQPSFCITDGINVYSRHLFKKDRCLKLFDNVTEDMTEREMQIRNGYYRLWDCGTYKVRWTR